MTATFIDPLTHPDRSGSTLSRVEWVDTHCHLNDPNLSTSVEEAVANARRAGVVQLVVPGMNLSTTRRAVALASQFPGVCFAAVGVHPHNVLQRPSGVSAQAIAEMKDLIDSAAVSTHEVRRTNHGSEPRTSYVGRRIVAVGEIGIDYHHYDRAKTGPVQREAFATQLTLATDLDLPAIVHGRGASDDVLDVIRAHPKSRGVLHSFEAPSDIAMTALDAGWLIGITALITYSSNDELRKTVAKLPLDRLMLETDTPYLPPQSRRTNHDARSTGPNPVRHTSNVVGARGRNNQPAYLVETAQVLADLQGVDLETVAATTTTTARRFFGLPPLCATSERP